MSTNKDEEIQALERKLELTSKLVEMLETRISTTEKLSKERDSTLDKKEQEILRLQESLERERNRPVQITQSSEGSGRRVDLSKINAAELLCEAERRGVRWGH